MGAYCSVDDLGLLGVNPSALEKLDDEKKTTAIAAAQATVDSYLRAADRYIFPITAVGPDLQQATAILAAAQLYRVYLLRPAEDWASNALKLEADRIMKWLGLVQDGDVLPELTDSSSSAPLPGAIGAEAVIVSDAQRGFQSAGAWYGLPFQGRRSR